VQPPNRIFELPDVWEGVGAVRDILVAIQAWYVAHCDGDWEHQFGLKIETIDNPGWVVEVDSCDTNLHGAVLQMIEERTDSDWVRLSSDGEVFRGFGGPRNLTELLERFLGWAEAVRRDAPPS